MRRALLLTSVLAMTLGGTVAQAESYRGGGDRQHARQHRGDHRFVAPRHFQRGQILPHAYRGRGYVITDYRRYKLRPPPRGYHYYRSGNDILLTAAASGLIGLVIGNAISGPAYPPPPVHLGYAPPPPPPPMYHGPAYDERGYDEPVYDEPVYDAPMYQPRQDRN